MSIDRNRYRLGRVAAVGAASLLTLSLLSLPTSAAETAMWGFTPGRNMANDATGLPQTWNVETGENILWKAALVYSFWVAGPLIWRVVAFGVLCWLLS